MSKMDVNNALYEALHGKLHEGIIPDKLEELLEYSDAENLFYELCKWLPTEDLEKFAEDKYREYDLDFEERYGE